jgi:TIR domain-containing protein
MTDRPKAFLSYSHADKEFAVELTDRLRQSGVDLWLDKYEIRPGDSLIDKIFSEGLSKTEFFLVLLSVASTQSKWVQEELNAAMIKRIEGVTRIIPILKEHCEIPLQLRPFKWVDLSSSYETGLKDLVRVIHDVTDKPAIGTAPDYVTALKHSVGGLSKEASTVGLFVLSTDEDETGFEKRFWSRDLHSSIPSLSTQEFNDAVDELESNGLVKAHKVFGNAPYYFGDVAPTYALYLHFKDEGLTYDPIADIKAVAAAIVAKESLRGPELQQLVPISPGRLNRAVSYLEDYGYIRVIKTFGTRPFDFRDAIATRQTRQFAKDNCA